MVVFRGEILLKAFFRGPCSPQLAKRGAVAINASWGFPTATVHTFELSMQRKQPQIRDLHLPPIVAHSQKILLGITQINTTAGG